MMDMQKLIDALFEKKQTYSNTDMDIFKEFKQALNEGKIRACEKIKDEWIVNTWIKKGILLGFRMGILTEMNGDHYQKFYDKDTYPLKKLRIEDKVRIVPGGTSIRDACYIAPGVTIMPPAYVNAGAYIDEGCMIDSHALVGSCAQVGKNVHLSAAAILGGVLEPIGSNPVIIEDNVFIGGNTGLYEGVIVKEGAIIAAGTIITAGTPVYDAVNKKYLAKTAGKAVIIPTNAVIVPGSRELASHPGFHAYCPIIIKYRDAKSERSVELEMDLR
jgi:2,3,4,5-tetrahydropyridine-2,6-dicarboxylate N-succinyltransferase